MSKAPASDVSPAGLRKMAEIAAPNNGAVFRAAADEIERLSARAEPSTPPAGEREDALRRALEIIALGDAQNPQAQAAEELIALGFWRDIPEARAALAAQPEPAAQDKEDAERLSVSTITRAIQSIKGSTYNLTKDECIFVLENLRDDAARAATKPQGGA